MAVVDPAELQACADKWQVSSALALGWYRALTDDSYFARGVWFPFGTGSVVAVSTPESNRLGRLAWELNANGMQNLNPEWFAYEVYFFHELAPGNVAGITNAIHPGHRSEGNLADCLDQWYHLKSPGTQWRKQYGEQWSGPYWLGFRQCLLGLGIDGWLEVLCGRSWQQYHCLDLYVRYVSRSVIAPRSDAWYLLGAEFPPMERPWLPLPEDWWQYQVWHSWGQKAAMPEYDFEHNVWAIKQATSRL